LYILCMYALRYLPLFIFAVKRLLFKTIKKWSKFWKYFHYDIEAGSFRYISNYNSKFGVGLATLPAFSSLKLQKSLNLSSISMI